MSEFYNLLLVFIGLIGFGLIFNIKKERIIYTAVGGVLTSFIYIVSCFFISNIFLCNIIASIFATLFSEISARLYKAPATVFLILSIIPLAPGGSLYYTIINIISGNTDKFNENGKITAMTTLGIAAGIIIASVFIKTYAKTKVYEKIIKK